MQKVNETDQQDQVNEEKTSSGKRELSLVSQEQGQGQPIPDELCPHVELGEPMVGGFVFAAENPVVNVEMCQQCLDACHAAFKDPIKMQDEAGLLRRVRQAVADVPTYIRGRGYDQAKTLKHYRADVLAAIDAQKGG